jgi:hypothetical protein
MKVILSTIAMILVAAAIIFKMVGSTRESIASMEAILENHFSLIQTGNYREAYNNFHQDLQRRISPEEYETAWMRRIEKFGPLQSWEIHTANKSSNLFSDEQEYDVQLFVGFVSDKGGLDRVHQIWRIEGGETKLIYSGLHDSTTNSSNFNVY